MPQRLNARAPKLLKLRQELFNRCKYEPHSEQALYHETDARFRVPVCGRRFGKSMMAGMDVVPRLFIPNTRAWIIGPTYDLGEKEFRVAWEALIVKLQLGRDKRVKYAYNRRSGTMFIEFPWQSRLEVRSADHPENLVGESLDHVIMSEAAKHKIETWERYVRPALTDRRGTADFPTTPEGFNWLHDLWQLGQNKKFPDFASWKFPSWANYVVYPGGRDDAEIKLLEATTTPEWFMQEIGADFASFVGKIFPEWDEAMHVDSDVTFHPEWPSYMAFDWGYTNPLAAVEFQISPDDEVHIWREHYKSFTTLPDHIAILKNRDHPEGYHLDLAFGDPADPEAAATVSRELVPCIAMQEVKSKFTWRDGVDLMRSFMKPIDRGIEVDEFGTPAAPRPRYHVSPDCVNVIKEHNNYRSKEPIKGQNVPEFGSKMDDHTLDAIRYGLVHIYKLGAISSLADMHTGREWRPTASHTTLGSHESLTTLNDDIDGAGGGFGNMDGMEF